MQPLIRAASLSIRHTRTFCRTPRPTPQPSPSRLLSPGRAHLLQPKTGEAQTSQTPSGGVHITAQPKLFFPGGETSSQDCIGFCHFGDKVTGISVGVVADGLGSTPGSEHWAASLAKMAVSEPAPCLDVITSRLQSNPALPPEAGTTATIVVYDFLKEEMSIQWVGDSPVYVFQDEKLIFHNLPEVDSKMSDVEKQAHLETRHITEAITKNSQCMVKTELVKTPVNGLLLGSDWLSDNFTKTGIEKLFKFALDNGFKKMTTLAIQLIESDLQVENSRAPMFSGSDEIRSLLGITPADQTYPAKNDDLSFLAARWSL